MKPTYETFLNPKYDLAEAKSLQDFINRIQALLMTVQAMRKDGLKYESCDHVHNFYTTDPKLAKKWDMRKMERDEV